MGLTDDIHRTGPINWITVDARSLQLGDILLCTISNEVDCYGIVTRCYETTGGSMFCHLDIGMDSIPRRFDPEEKILIGRAA